MDKKVQDMSLAEFVEEVVGVELHDNERIMLEMYEELKLKKQLINTPIYRDDSYTPFKIKNPYSEPTV